MNGYGDQQPEVLGEALIAKNSDNKKRTRNSSTLLSRLSKKLRAEETPDERIASPVVELSDSDVTEPDSPLSLNSDHDGELTLPLTSTPLPELSNPGDLDNSKRTLINVFKDLDKAFSVLEDGIEANLSDTESLESGSRSFHGFDPLDPFDVPPIEISSDEGEDDKDNGQNEQPKKLEEAKADDTGKKPDDSGENPDDSNKPDVNNNPIDSVKPDHNNNPDDYNYSDATQTIADIWANPINLNIKEERRLLEKITDLRPRVKLCKGQIARAMDFTILRLVGQGAFGSVYMVRKLDGDDAGMIYAMKVISKMMAIRTLNSAQHIKRERLILEAIHGTPFLVSLYYAFQNQQNLYLIMNFVPGGELYRRITCRTSLSEQEVCLYVAEIVVALEELHKRNILYRDLKLENILIDPEGHIVIADFGLTTVLTAEQYYRAHTYCGTLEYMAPEVILMSPEGYGKPVDCWSLGVLTFELLTGSSPFARLSVASDQQNIETQRRILNEEPQIPPSFSPTVSDFVLKLLDKDSTKRLDTSTIREHPFFEVIDWWRLSEKRYRMPFLPNLNAVDDVQHFDHQFTGQPIAVPVGESPPRNLRLYRGYEYTAPQILDWTRMLDDENVEYRNSEVENIPHCPQDMELGRKLCSGGFGTCYHLKDNKLAKVIHLSKFRVAEIDALMSCSHENIVKYYGTFRNGVEIWIITEYLSGYDLIECIRNGNLNERFSRIIFLQMVRAIRHLHNLHFIHGDLKPDNVVWKNGREMTVKLVDFGLACYNAKFELWKDVARYTIDYAPPEMLTDDGYATYSPAVDIYGLGATLYTMVVGHPPYRVNLEDVSQSPMTLRTVKRLIKLSPFNQAATKWTSASQAFRSLVTWCLEKDAAARPKLEDILNSEWLRASADEEPEDGAEDEGEGLRASTVRRGYSAHF